MAFRRRLLGLPGIRQAHEYVKWVKDGFAPVPYPPDYEIPRWVNRKLTWSQRLDISKKAVRMYIRSFSDPSVIDHGILDPKELEKKLLEDEKESELSLGKNIRISKQQAKQGVQVTRTALEAFRDGLINFVEGYKEGRAEATKEEEEEQRNLATANPKATQTAARGKLSQFLSFDTDSDEREARFKTNKYRKLRQSRYRIAKEIKEEAEYQAEEARLEAEENEREAAAAKEAAKKEALLTLQVPDKSYSVGQHRRRRKERRLEKSSKSSSSSI